MRGSGCGELPAGGEALQPVLPDGLQHPQAWLAIALLHLAQQVVLQQRAHPIQDGARSQASRLGDSLDGRQVAAADEDGEPAEELLHLWGEQLVAPGDGGAHGLLAGRHVARAAGQHLQALGEAGEQGLRREQPGARGRQFDGQGQPVQASADLGDGMHRRLRDLERRLDGLRTLNEEGTGGRLREGFG